MFSILVPPDKDLVFIAARAELPGKPLGHLAHSVYPGQQFYGWSYEELRQLGDGTWDLPLKSSGKRPVRMPPATEQPQEMAGAPGS